MSRKPIFLVGSMRKQITGSKLPCQRDVLSVLFYNMREVKLNLHDSASLVIDECLIFWKKARIPTQDRSDCIKKCKKLYENFKKLGKHKTRASISCRQKEKEFEDSLNNLFDIAHANALDIIKISEDKEFLLMQRKNGRPGCMLGIDMKLTTAELKKAAQEEKELQRRRKQYCEIASTVHDYLSSFTDSSNESEMEIETDIPFSSQPGTSKSEEYAETETENNFSSSPKLSKSKRARKNILTARLSAALDRCKISDRDAVHILTACVDAINLNPQEFVINRTSIKTAREYYRKKISLDVKSKFYNLNLNFVVIHWDSKILPDITGKKNVDRLPVIATAPNVEQLLGVPELSSGTGREISSAVYDTLHEWSLLDIVQAVVFDTTASNTGRLKGACYLLEQKLDRDILFLACRHHIFEIVLQGVFDEIQLFPSKGPDVPLFKRFKNTWKDIDQTQYLTWLSDASVREMLKDDANEILLYAKKKIEEDLPRDDYQEFLELIIIFLGETPSRGIHFHQPGACHLARWMAKAIYCLKIYMFRQQFKLTHKEEKALRRICCFIIKCYAEAWFSAPNAIEAPLNDINFLKKLIAYKIDDKLVAEKAINKFINHLWYLNEECAAFSIFDERISDEERRDIAQKILLDRETNEADEKNDKEPEEMRKKLFIKLDDLEYFLNKDLPQEIITNNSKKLFGRFEISQDFLQLDPMHWKDQDSYKKGRKIINSLRVVNDTAERGVKLMEEFNSKFTYDESQKQFILQAVQDYRKSDDLVPNFGLNSVEDAQQNGIINFGNKRTGPIAPILFRLLKTCCMKLNEHEELDEIDALLGCEMLMPRNFDIPEPSTLDLIICGINWLREIILGFVTQTDPLLRGQVLKRLDTLIYLQGELNMLLTLCDTKYQPPPCYFHYFPLPPFIKIEKKISKKGKKPGKVNKMNTSVMIENESWEIGSTLCSKNPAYFRKFDAKIAYLLDVKIEEKLSQSKTQGISIKQVCFLVKELLATFENEPSEYYVKDLIHVLPKICSKLDDVVDRLRQDDNYDFRNGARLLLHLLTSIFNWKGFSSVTYNTLLREGLRNLARQVNEENTRLRSCKELVAESYKYFESLSDIATEISLATALVNICQALMKHSETYVQEYKGKHAKLAYGFLCLEWPNDKHTGPQYKLSIIQLLSNWLDNEPSPLDTVTSVLEWLPDDICNFESLLMRIPSVKRNIFHLLYKKLFDSLTKGINISLLTVNSDPERIKVWHNVASNVQKLVQICKTLKTKTIIQLFLQYMPPLIKQFLNTGMPILEHNLKYQTDDVTAILKMMQGGTRYLHAICCDCTEKKNLPMFKYVPTAKSTLEKLIYSVKGMLVLNDSAAAFWMGNLVNKNLDGREIFSQTSSDETGLPDINTNFQELANASSEILNSDLDENPVDETEDENDDIDDL